MIIKEVELTEEEILQIKDYNAELITFKNLIKEMDENTNEFIFNKIINSLKTAQINYDSWFESVQKKYNITTSPENSWNVDFNSKKLQLLR